MIRSQAELGQQRPQVGGDQLGQQPGEDVENRGVDGEQRSSLVDLADQHPGTERRPASVDRQVAEDRRQQRRLAGSVGPGDGHPVAPVQPRGHRSQGEAAAT